MTTTVSLATLDQLTPQQVFDHVVAHLRKQGQCSVIPGTTNCAYRGENGLKCAAGCLIADNEYRPDMEGLTWRELIYRYPVTSAHSSLISCLQEVHDEASPASWESQFANTAADFNLKYTPPGAEEQTDADR